MFKKNNMDKFIFMSKSIESLLSESRRLLKESETKDISIVKPEVAVLQEIKEIFENLSIAIQKNQDRANYEIMKYKLANKALNTGLWDMDVIGGDPVNPNNTFIWSDEFRHMLGFKDVNDFPNKLNSWSDRLHPEDKQQTLDTFAKHLLDFTGKTPYNLEYRLLLKNGEYRYFQALGDTVRDNDGKPLRVAGLLRDIAEEKKAAELHKQLVEHISRASGLIEGINKLVQDLNATIGLQAAAVDHSSETTEVIIASIKETSEISIKQQETVNELIEVAGQGQESMQKTIQSIKGISQSVEGISSAIQIIASIAANTNLLSMNAAIEAAHAGDAGRGFAVVAGEIRRLSETTRENSVSISRTLKNIIDGIANTSKQSGETDSRIAQMSKEINVFAETMSAFINTFKELSAKSGDITASLVGLKEQSLAVKTSYAEIFGMTEKLAREMNELFSISEK